jgi:hypothetical protein
VLPPSVKTSLTAFLANAHVIADAHCVNYYRDIGRRVYVTPKSFIDIVKGYPSLFRVKQVPH